MIMEIILCVGSSCHLKGAPAILTRINALIAEYGLQDQIQLSGSFCMEQCTKGSNGVCIRINGKIHIVTAATIDEVFYNEVIKPLREESTP